MGPNLSFWSEVFAKCSSSQNSFLKKYYVVYYINSVIISRDISHFQYSNSVLMGLRLIPDSKDRKSGDFDRFFMLLRFRIEAPGSEV